jgi:hypothetical protein
MDEREVERVARLIFEAKVDCLHKSGYQTVTWEGMETTGKKAYRAAARAVLADRDRADVAVIAEAR